MTRFTYGRSLLTAAVFLFFTIGGASAQSFEDQTVGDWYGNQEDGQYDTTVETTDEQSSDGNYSVKVTSSTGTDLSSGAFANDNQQVAAGDTLTYRIWVDQSNLDKIDSVQPFVQYTSWSTYEDHYYGSSSLTAGEWNAVGVRVSDTMSTETNRIALQVNLSDASQTATIYVDQITRNGEILPVELTAFDATLDGSDATVQWQTASETNNAGFDLQHKAPGNSSFEDVTFIDGAGTTTSPQSYSYELTDLSAGTHSFRLRQEDLDGSSTLTDPITVEIGAKQTELALEGSNPFRSSTQVRYSSTSDGQVQLTLYDVLGREVQSVFEGRLSAESVQRATIDGSDLSAGVYFLRLDTPTDTKTQRLTIAE